MTRHPATLGKFPQQAPMEAERDRLKSLNEALEDIWQSRRHGEALAIARAVLAKAKGD